MRLRHAAILLLAGAVAAAPAFADEISDQIDRAMTAYQNHNTERALTALDAASQALRKQRADRLEHLLPIPPAGWTGDPPETSAVSAAMLGGGTSATRTYHLADQQVTVQLTTDSPMLQQMATLVNSETGPGTGAKSTMVGGRSMTYTATDNGLMSLVGNAIVKINGNAQTSEATLRTFAATIDFNALEGMSR